jgi:hypothetical protein
MRIPSSNDKHNHVEDVNGVSVAKSCSVTSPWLQVSMLLAAMQNTWLLMFCFRTMNEARIQNLFNYSHNKEHRRV